MSKPVLVYMEWADVISDAQWRTVSEVDNWLQASKWIIKEAGWLVAETADYVVIALSHKAADDHTAAQFCNLHRIPKSLICKRRIIKDQRTK